MKYYFLNRKYFRRIFFSYMALVLVGAMFSSGMIFNDIHSSSNARADWRKTSDARMLAQHLDARFQSISQICGKMGEFGWVNKFVSGNEPDPIERRKIIQDITTYFGGGEFYNNVCIAFPEQNVIVSRWGWFQIEDFFRFAGPNTPQSIQSSIYEPSYFSQVYPDSITIQGISYLWLLKTLSITSTPRVQTIILLDQLRMQQYLQEIMPLESNVEIRDSIGNIVAKVSSVDINAEDKGNKEIIIPSAFSEWSYVIRYPKSTITLEPKDLIIFSLPILFALLVGPFAAYFLASLSYQPVRNLMDKVLTDSSLSKSEPAETEFAVIERYLEQISHSNRAMKQKMTEYQSYTIKGLLQQLLLGYFESENAETRFLECGLDYSEETSFAVMVIRPNTKEEVEKVRLLQWNIAMTLFMEETLSETPYDHQSMLLSQDGVVIILSDNSQKLNDNTLNDLMIEIENKMVKTWEKKPLICCGKVETGFLGVSLSYQYAKEKANYLMFSPSSNTKQKTEELFIYSYYYPTDWEIQLINNLKVAKLDSVEKILDELQTENERRKLSPFEIQALLQTMRSTLMRVATELNVTDLEDKMKEYLKQKEDVEIVLNWEWIHIASKVICCRNVYHWPDPDKLGVQMLKYVEEHFTEETMSLKEVASYFDTSITMVSHLFKSAANLNFSNYLLRLRMERAKEIMRTEKKSLQEISESVGYSNKNSFKRAFLRFEGISPYEYRTKITGLNYADDSDFEEEPILK